MLTTKIKLIFQPQTFTLGQNEGNLCLRQDVGQDGVEDLTQLDDLHEASLLWNLRLRYDSSHFYTYVGSILVSINPYTLFPDLYGLEMAKKYAGAVLGKFKYLHEINLCFLFKYFFGFSRSIAAASICNRSGCAFVARQPETESGHNHYRGIWKW